MVKYHPMFPLTPSSGLFFSVLGRALYTAQHLEMSCRNLAGVLEMRDDVMRSGLSILDNAEFHETIRRRWGKPLHKRMLRIVEEFPFLEGGTDAPLRDARAARNTLVHDVAISIDSAEALDARLEQDLEHIGHLVKLMAHGEKLVVGIHAILVDEAIKASDSWETYEQRVLEWVLSGGTREQRY